MADQHNEEKLNKPSCNIRQFIQHLCVCYFFPSLTTTCCFGTSSHPTLSSSHPSPCPPICSHQHWKVEVGSVCEHSAEWTGVCMFPFCVLLQS